NGSEEKDFTEPFTRTYYDGHDFVGGTPDIYIGKIRRQETRILGTNDWLNTTLSYDDFGRTIKTEGNHHLQLGNPEAEILDITYDFADNPLLQIRTHIKADGSTLTIQDRMTYDASARLENTYHRVNSDPEVQLSGLTYTAKDQVDSKGLGYGSQGALQTIDFHYLNNGMLWKINQENLGGTNIAAGSCTLPNPGTAAPNDLFYLELSYDDPAKQYYFKDGNIARLTWRVRGRERQAYAFTYDYQDRLLTAEYGDQNDAGNVDWTNKTYNTFYSYDDRGNIQTLSRRGQYWNGSCYTNQVIDSLSYSYHSTSANRLKSITDAAPAISDQEGFHDNDLSGDYAYDANGNMNFDPYKNMDISYNYLNLPRRITIDDCKFIDILYDASGTKLRKTVRDGAMTLRTQDYVGGIEYRNQTLEAIYHSEGRVYFEGTTSRYEYNITDHLGNTRVTFTDKDGDGIIAMSDDPEDNEVLSEMHYYPFGMQMKGAWMENVGKATNYHYNGKELNKDFGLNWLDYGARWYDASIGRWNAVDPLAEMYYSTTSFQYTLNNPVRYIDPDGTSTHTDSSGNIVAVYQDGDNGVYKHGISAYEYDGHKLSNTGGQLMGETEFWDEFINPESGEMFANYTIDFKLSYDEVIIEYANIAFDKDYSLIDVASKSGPEEEFDIKSKNEYENRGGKLNGYYVSSRSVGNYLAGFNAARSFIFGAGVTFDKFQKLAGAVHIKGKLTKQEMIGIYLSNAAYQGAPPPEYGEIPYQYRQSKAGYEAGKATLK
ncbi:MAG: RHS repeat-associated core domain-containing protein, partial [Bacteroidota bacterium]